MTLLFSLHSSSGSRECCQCQQRVQTDIVLGEKVHLHVVFSQMLPPLVLCATFNSNSRNNNNSNNNVKPLICFASFGDTCVVKRAHTNKHGTTHVKVDKYKYTCVNLHLGICKSTTPPPPARHSVKVLTV